MRIATAAQMAEIDRETIRGGVPGLTLMENAGREMTWQLLREFPDLSPPSLITVVCGKGNNGGDGLVVARLLENLGFEVHVMLLAEPESLSADARANLDRLPASVTRDTIPPDRWAARVYERSVESELIVDAVFGTGITPPVRDDYADLFEAVNAGPCAVLSLDIPSGVAGDSGAVDPVAIRADATFTVGLPKLGLLLPPGRDHAGRLSVLDIGFAEEVCERHTGDLHYLLPEDYADLLPPRTSTAHKYDAGTALVVAGSRGFGGAALLAGLGALRSGAGLVTLALPENHTTAALGFVPEALIRALPTGASGAIAPLAPAAWSDLMTRQDALAVGPG
ncbi:NAD(P)H-hydrate epimerase, partial [bacterium]|nr:NAD(P)H-hydrate epimerase [bacterium]